ncbi:MAG TPA: 30S ribosomal protein S20 [Candidatus Andersenbacteria bacterium]|nr:30S ribosomal protein S20 [Candidatus Andersenbacteria bacterium]
MPQLSAGKKALRANARRRAINDAWRKKIREAKKAIREAVESKDSKRIAEEAVKAESIFDRAARRNVIHPNEAARRKSRLRKIQTKVAAK